jgi:flavin-dependent dehydrogenase
LSLKAAAGVNIIGAGLAGSLLAILLAKRGFAVTVYERRPIRVRRLSMPGARSTWLWPRAASLD